MNYGLIVAAGKGTRMKSELPKQLMNYEGSTVLETVIRKFYEHQKIDAVVVVSPADGSYEEEYKRIVSSVLDANNASSNSGQNLQHHASTNTLPNSASNSARNSSKKILLCRGGKERADSVLNGLKLISQDVQEASQGLEQNVSIQDSKQNASMQEEIIVLIHDAARPGVDAAIIDRNLDAMKTHRAVTTVMPAVDSIRIIATPQSKETALKSDASTDATAIASAGAMANTTLKETAKYPIIKSTVVERQNVFCVQTPQTFRLEDILSAYTKVQADGYLGTDDASVAEYAGIEVALVEGSRANNKITTREDISMTVRTGMGYDVHKLVPDRDLILCGTPVPYEKGLLGHSDADVATHALMDALLGAAGLGDIGRHFPDTDEQYRGANSLTLLAKVREMLSDYTINNVDVTIIAQAPKLAPYNKEMKANIARTLGILESQVNIKATTTEGLGFTGTKEGIAAMACCAIEK